MRTPRRQVVAIPKQEGDSSRTVRKIGDSQVKWSIDLTREFNAAGVAAYPTVLLFRVLRQYSFIQRQKEESMAWTTPVLVEICIGLEINGYMPADGYVPPEF